MKIIILTFLAATTAFSQIAATGKSYQTSIKRGAQVEVASYATLEEIQHDVDGPLDGTPLCMSVGYEFEQDYDAEANPLGDPRRTRLPDPQPSVSFATPPPSGDGIVTWYTLIDSIAGTVQDYRDVSPFQSAVITAWTSSASCVELIGLRFDFSRSGTPPLTYQYADIMTTEQIAHKLKALPDGRQEAGDE